MFAQICSEWKTQVWKISLARKLWYVIIISIYEDMYLSWYEIIPYIYDYRYGVKYVIIPSIFNYIKLYKCMINIIENE